MSDDEKEKTPVKTQDPFGDLQHTLKEHHKWMILCIGVLMSMVLALCVSVWVGVWVR